MRLPSSLPSPFLAIHEPRISGYSPDHQMSHRKTSRQSAILRSRTLRLPALQWALTHIAIILTEVATMPFPGASARTTGHARSVSEGTHQSVSSGCLRESHFDSGFPWKSLSPRMRISSPIQGFLEPEHTEVASSGSSTIPMTRSSYVSRDYTIGNRFSSIFDVQSSADLV